jgi:hypothetical protein
VTTRLNATTGAALLGTDAQLLHQEYRRVLAPVAGEPLRGARQLGFRELVYFELIGSLGEQGLQLSPAQKQEVFQVLVRKLESTSTSNWLRRPGQLVRQGAVPFSLDLASFTTGGREQSSDLFGPTCVPGYPDSGGSGGGAATCGHSSPGAGRRLPPIEPAGS